MKTKIAAGLLGAMLTVSIGFVSAHAATTFIDNSTTGFYNSGIGMSLNGTNLVVPDPAGGATYMFPNDYQSTVGPGVGQNPSAFGNDPTLSIPSSTEPDLITAAAALGNWLTTPGTPGGTWSAVPVAIPSTWTVNTETGIMYGFVSSALLNVVASFGVDNGIFLWLDGNFIGGELRPGGASAGEHVFNLGNLAAGIHWLQILREDHGASADWTIKVTHDSDGAQINPVPVPGALVLLFSALTGLGFLGRSRSKAA